MPQCPFFFASYVDVRKLRMSHFFDKKRSKRKSFWRCLQICFILAFFYSLLIELRFLLHLTVEKRKNTIKFGLQQFTCITGAVK